MIKNLSLLIALLCANMGLAQQFEALISNPLNESVGGVVVVPDGYIIAINEGADDGSNIGISSRVVKLNLQGDLVAELDLVVDSSVIVVLEAFEWQGSIRLVGTERDLVSNQKSIAVYSVDNDLTGITRWQYSAVLKNQVFAACMVDSMDNLLIHSYYPSPQNGNADSTRYFKVDASGAILVENTITNILTRVSFLVEANENYVVVSQNLRLELDKSSLAIDTFLLISNNSYISRMHGQGSTDSTYIELAAGLGSSINDYQVQLLTWNYDHQLLNSYSYGVADSIDWPAFKGLDVANGKVFLGGVKNFTFVNSGNFFDHVSWDYQVFATDPSGNILWEVVIDDHTQLNLYDIVATPDGGCLLAGTRWDYAINPRLEKDIYVVKIDGNGDYVSAISELHNTAESVLYPNPTNGALTVEYTEGIQRIEVFTISGQLVQTHAMNGQTSVRLNLENEKPGVYLLQTIGNTSKSVRRVVVG